jgi:hypothetical protein
MSAPRIALATARTAWEHDEDAPLLVDALTARGARVAPAIWDDPALDWSAFDLVVVRSTWDYTDRRDEFLAWAERVESVTRLANPAGLLRWNTDKGYLGELHDDGVAVVPTAFVRVGETDGRARAADPFALVAASGDVVVKPTVSAGSKDTARYRAQDADAAGRHALALLDDGRDVMVQPYQASVDERGETGMVLLHGELSHAFRKGPLLLDGAADVDGLFAPEQITGRVPSEAEVSLARAAYAAIVRRTGVDDLLYARIDVLAGPDGEPVLLEAELTEPSLFLAQSPGAAERAAAAVLATLER